MERRSTEPAGVVTFGELNSSGSTAGDDTVGSSSATVAMERSGTAGVAATIAAKMSCVILNLLRKI